MSLPSRERGLKFCSAHTTRLMLVSLPSRERGLKLMKEDGTKESLLSLPSRERGLKLRSTVHPRLPVRRSLRGSVD